MVIGFPVLSRMSVITCLLLLGASTSAAVISPKQLENFFDSILEEGRFIVSSTTKIPNNDLKTAYLDLSLSLGDISIRGPTTLERKDSTSGVQTAEQAHAEAMVNLGEINFDIKKVTFKFFGYSYTTELHFAIMNAEAPIIIDIFRNNLATCQVSVKVLQPIGNYVVHFGPQGAPAFLSALLNYGISYLLQLIPLDSSFIKNHHFLPDFTSHINGGLTIAAKRIAC